jgi:hypothetical protein
MKNLQVNMKARRSLIAIAILLTGRLIYCQGDSKTNLTQFYFPEFIQGNVKLKTGKIIQTNLNYNLLSEKMTFIENGKIMDLINPEAVDTVFIQDKKFIFNDNVFLEIIIEKPVSLFFEHTGSLVSTGKAGPYGTKSQTTGPTSLKRLVNDANTYNLKLPQEYKVVPSFVSWIKVNNDFNKILTMNQFLSLFPGKKDQLKQFIRTNRIKISDPDGMKRLVLFCNNKLN